MTYNRVKSKTNYLILMAEYVLEIELLREPENTADDFNNKIQFH